MTRWGEVPAGGRPRGPVGLGRAWVAVLVRPRRYYRSAVAPGEQAPALTFAMAVVLVEEASRLALVPGAVPELAGGRLASAALVVGLAVLLVAPAGLHLVAALQTLLLWPVAPDRGGVGETVQVVAYAAGPCALAGVPIPAVRVACAAYASWLLIVGLATVHRTSRRRAALAAAIPAALVFGYGFRGFRALGELLAAWYII